MRTITTPYHSREWDGLVETGWVTALVDWWPAYVGGPIIAWATMIYEPKRRRLWE